MIVAIEQPTLNRHYSTTHQLLCVFNKLSEFYYHKPRVLSSTDFFLITLK